MQAVLNLASPIRRIYCRLTETVLTYFGAAVRPRSDGGGVGRLLGLEDIPDLTFLFLRSAENLLSTAARDMVRGLLHPGSSLLCDGEITGENI